jgi:hypothetical protein
MYTYIYIYICIYIHTHTHTEATKISAEAPSVKAQEESFVPCPKAQELLKEIKKAQGVPQEEDKAQKILKGLQRDAKEKEAQAKEEALLPWPKAQELLKEIKKAMAPSKVKPSMLKSMNEVILK